VSNSINIKKRHKASALKPLYFKALRLHRKKGARQNKNGIQFEREAGREVSHGNGSDHKGQRLMGRRVSHTPVSVSRFSLSLPPSLSPSLSLSLSHATSSRSRELHGNTSALTVRRSVDELDRNAAAHRCHLCK